MAQQGKSHPAVVVTPKPPVNQGARGVPTTVAAEVIEKLLWFVNG